jgi:RNA polymerase sigma-70 factor (ECF subfamily)
MDRVKEDIINYVKSYTKDLFGYAITKVHQKEAAEDLVQDTFLSACRAYENYEGRSNVKTWLFSILKNKIADHFRAKYKNNAEVFADITEQFFDDSHRWKPEYKPKEWPGEKELLDDPEFSETLQNCLESLPEKWLSVVHLKFLQEHETSLICAELQMTKSNFWQIIHRSKLQLRNCLELKWFKK